MRRTPLTLALAFAGALSFAAIAGAQTDQAGGQSGTGGQSGAGQSGTTGSSAGSGGQAGTGTQTGSGMGAPGGQMGSTSAKSSNANSDQKYLDQIAIGNMAEIELSQLAVQNAQDPQVKQFAQTMVDGHTKAKEQLQQVASAAGVSLPTELDSKHQKMQSKLQGLSGQNFDREYMKLMVSSHKDMESLLKKKAGKEASASASGNYGSSSGATGTSGSSGSTTGTTGTTGSTAAGSGGSIDAQVNNLAATLLPEVQQHLQQAKDIEKQLNQSGKSSKDNDKSAK